MLEKMDETTASLATSSLAITEKRPQRDRPGGCVGIFFQLFDWNRRFAKKKLFSRKLLPPGLCIYECSSLFFKVHIL